MTGQGPEKRRSVDPAGHNRARRAACKEKAAMTSFLVGSARLLSIPSNLATSSSAAQPAAATTSGSNPSASEDNDMRGGDSSGDILTIKEGDSSGDITIGSAESSSRRTGRGRRTGAHCYESGYSGDER